jgi:NitT/TauT family transport system substrate-binding protein
MLMRLGRVLALGLALILVAGCAAPAGPAPASGPAAVPEVGPPRALGATAPADVPLDRVRISYPSRSVTFLVQLLAHDQGYYQQEGLSVELLQMRTNVGLTALLNGEVDYTASFGTNLRAALQGAPVKNFSVSMRAPVFGLVARPEYPTAAQLRGRTVGITNFGGSNEQAARLALQHFGLVPQRDVSLIPVGDAPVQYEALRLGQVDAIVVSLPFPLLARKEGFHLLANTADLVDLPLSGLGTTHTKLATQRDQVKRVAKADSLALRHLRTHPDDAIALIADLFEIDAASAREVYEFVLPSFSEDGIIDRASIELLLELEGHASEGGASPIAYEQLVDPTIVPEVRRELGTP